MGARTFAVIGLVALSALASCGDDDDSDSDTTSTSSTTPPSAVVVVTDVAPTATSLVPGPAGPAGTTVPGTPATPAAPSTYTVVSGDSLFRIAERNCITLDALVAANAWPDGVNHTIHPGDAVQIPGSCGAPAAPAAGGTVPANFSLPYRQPAARSGVTPECVQPLAMYDAAFNGPPTDASEEAARQWMSSALAALRAAIVPLGDRLDVTAALDALDQSEPAVAAAYVTFLRDTTNGASFAAMQAAVDAAGPSRFVLATHLATACPST